MSRTYQVIRTTCSGEAPPSAQDRDDVLQRLPRLRDEPVRETSPRRPSPTMPPTNTISPRALMPLA